MEKNDIPQPYCDPNAYIHKPEDTQKPQKVVFQEPYECMPQYRVDNNFKKGDCDCVKSKEKKKEDKPSFDISRILPLLSSIGGNGVGDIMKALSGGVNIPDIVSNFSAQGGLGSLLKGLDFNKMFKKPNIKKQEMKSTDFCIKDYKRVD